MATLTQTIDIASPAVSDNFNEIYEQIRDLITAISERMNLDHAFDGTENDDTDADCDGYHTKITMRGDLYDTTNFPENIPSCPTNGFVFFSIGGELCCYDGNTAKQITDNGGIAISDPVNPTTGISSFVSKVVFGKGIFVAISQSGEIVTSQDCISWTTRYDSTNLFIQLYYCNNGFFVFDANSACLYSSDGITWSSLTINYGSDLQTIAYGNGAYVATGDKITGQYSRFTRSTNGTTWAWNQTTFTYANCYSIIYANDLFVAVFDDGTIATSPDGLTWTERLEGLGKGLVNVIYANDLFVAVGKIIVISTDGITWTKVKDSGTYSRKVIYNGIYLAIGTKYGGNCYSYDGTTWYDMNYINDDISDITYGDGLCIAVNVSGNIYESIDGLSWTNVMDVEHALSGCLYNDGVFVVYGSLGRIKSFEKYKTLE